MQINKLQSAMISIRLFLSDEDPLDGRQRLFLWLPLVLTLLLLCLTPVLGVLIPHDRGRLEDWVFYVGGFVYPSTFAYVLVVLISYTKTLALWERAAVGFVATGFIWLLSIMISMGGGGLVHFDSLAQIVFSCAVVLQAGLIDLFH